MIHVVPLDDDVEGEGFIDVVDLLDVEELDLGLADFAVEEGGVVAFWGSNRSTELELVPLEDPCQVLLVHHEVDLLDMKHCVFMDVVQWLDIDIPLQPLALTFLQLQRKLYRKAIIPREPFWRG